MPRLLAAPLYSEKLGLATAALWNMALVASW
jgi:hypothetical protein